MKWLILFTFLLSGSCLAIDKYMSNMILNAIGSYSITKVYVYNTKKQFGITREHVKYLTLSKLIVSRKISTKYINKLEYKYKDFRVNFEADWDFENRHISGSFNMYLSF